MKTHDRRKITIAFSRRYVTAAMTLLLLSGIFTNAALAQGDKRGGERNHTMRDDNNRQNTVREQPPRNDKRNDVVIDRANPPRDMHQDQNPGTIKPDRNRNWNNNSTPDINKDRDNKPGNDNRERRRDWNNNNNNSNNNTPDINRDRNNRPGNDNREHHRDWNNNNSKPDINRNNRPGNDNRGNRNFDRPGGNNNYHPVIYTRDRPGDRPEYRYDRRPVYDRYNPCWRYDNLPRRNSYYSSLPSTYFSINFGGFGYRYWDGVFYRPYNNLFSVCAPPVGIFINILPVGYSRIYVHNNPYYYYNGTYYDQRGNNYYVVSPPVGAIVESLPDGYETVAIDGETYYTVDGAQYKPVVQYNGEIGYEVIKAN